MRAERRRSLLLPSLLLTSSASLSGCAPPHGAPISAPTATRAAKGAPPARTDAVVEARWEDVFDEIPEVLVVVRPQSLCQDRIYGPLFRQAVRLARERSKVVAATRMAEPLEDAEEIVLGIRAAGVDRPAELLLVESGVRADVDPARLVDDEGAPVWAPGPSGLAGPVRELVHDGTSPARPERGPDQDLAASLFELPGRTWVIASGPARARAREVFAHPVSRAPFALDPRALALVRIDGASLVSHVEQLRGGGALSPVGHGLVSTLVSLPPGADHAVRVVLDYAEDDAALDAESTLRDAFAALGRSKLATLHWLGDAKVERTRRSVAATAPLPPNLIDALLSAGGAPVPPQIP